MGSDRPYGNGMSIQPTSLTLRESVDELGSRLARIGAAAVTLRNLTAEMRAGIRPSTPLRLADDLERDLALAAHQRESVRERAQEQ
jgi:hypothetical protein